MNYLRKMLTHTSAASNMADVKDAISHVQYDVQSVRGEVDEMNARFHKVENIKPVATDVIKVTVDISLSADDPNWNAMLTDVPLLLVDSRALNQHPPGTVLVINQVFTPDDVRLSTVCGSREPLQVGPPDDKL